MNLDAAQRERVIEWVHQGLQPAEVQKRLAEELGLRLTYMEVRFLLAELEVKPKDKEVPAAPAPVANAKPAPGGGKPGAPAAAPGLDDDADLPGTGSVSVTVDQVTRPGAVVSGKVTFSDGKSAEWYLDQMGRLGLMPKEKGYKPAQQDVMEFQVALQNELAKLGF
jgi:hypothetical protein